MREFLTSDDICNQISMNRSTFKGTILLSEGNTDQRLYGKFIDRKEVKIIPAHSKDNVRSVIDKMSYREEGKILGIIDRDLDDFKGKEVSPPLFHTDYRDMEMMLINSSALEKVLMEFADPDRVERFAKQHGTVREAVLTAAYPLGLLMYVSYLRGYNLNFKNLNFRDFIDKRSLKVDLNKMIQTVIDNTAGCELSKKKVIYDLNGQFNNHPDKEKIARGHDSVDILLIALKDIIGSYNAGSLTIGSLGGALRIAYSEDDFITTELFDLTTQWSRSKGIKLWAVTQHRNLRS